MPNYSNSLSEIISFVEETVKSETLNNNLYEEDYEADTVWNRNSSNIASNLYNPINYLLLNKGKHVRGILAVLSYNMVLGWQRPLYDLSHSGSRDYRVFPIESLVLAIEGLHNFTLMHDDVMDNAILRRGKTTINKKWSNNQAILSGDVLMIHAYRHLVNIPNSPIKSFTRTAIQICEGQQLDFDMQQKTSITLDEYFEMVRLKTGALIKFSVVQGFEMAHYLPAHIQPGDGSYDRPSYHSKDIMDIGELLGTLFQIQDDYLDIYGEQVKTGKLIGGDILEKKKTFLYAVALNKSNSTQKKKLEQIYHSDNKHKVDIIYSIYNDLGVKEYVQEKIKNLGDDVLNLISTINEDAGSIKLEKELFIEFIKIILSRKF